MNIKKALLVSLLQLQASCGGLEPQDFQETVSSLKEVEKPESSWILLRKKALSDKDCKKALFNQKLDVFTNIVELMNQHLVLGIYEVDAPEEEQGRLLVFIQVKDTKSLITLPIITFSPVRKSEPSLCISKETSIEFKFSDNTFLTRTHQGNIDCDSFPEITMYLDKNLQKALMTKTLSLVRVLANDLVATYHVISSEKEFERFYSKNPLSKTYMTAELLGKIIGCLNSNNQSQKEEPYED